MLNDRPVACQIRGPTDPQGDRCPHIPAALAATYPLRCFAPQWARFDNRQNRPAHPVPPLHRVSGSGARGTSDPPNRQRPPPHFMRECIPPNLHDPQRAKGSLDRRSKRLSFPHFFLRRKKCGRRRPPPRQGKIDSPPQRRNPPRAKGFLNRRFEWFSLVTFFLQKKKVTRAGARNAPSRARRRNSPRQGKANSPPRRRNSPNPAEENTPTVAGASGRASLRAGERRHSPFDRQ